VAGRGFRRIGMGTVYNIKEYYDSLFVQHLDGKYLDYEQMQIVITKLQQTAEQLKHFNSQEDIRTQAESEFIGKELNAGEWIFGPNINDKRNSGECVYFIQNPPNPHLIKIGRTFNLKQRMKAFYWDIARGQYHLNCVAIIKTPAYTALENSLHRMFAQVRIDGEWFHSKPVLSFIDQFRR
jgi:hypothetical protein